MHLEKNYSYNQKSPELLYVLKDFKCIPNLSVKAIFYHKLRSVVIIQTMRGKSIERIKEAIPASEMLEFELVLKSKQTSKNK